MVFRLGSEAVEGAADRDPRRQRVQEPQRGERVAVRVRSPARGFVRLPRSRSIEDPRVRGGGRFGGGIGAGGPESSMARRGRASDAPTRQGGRPRARCPAVVVFPTAFGPSSEIAAISGKSSSNSSSTVLRWNPAVPPCARRRPIRRTQGFKCEKRRVLIAKNAGFSGDARQRPSAAGAPGGARDPLDVPPAGP